MGREVAAQVEEARIGWLQRDARKAADIARSDMDGIEKKWFESLRTDIRALRDGQPLPSRDSLPRDQEAQCQVIGGSLIAWLDKHGPRLLQERSVLAAGMHVEKEPYIVFTSTTPGLVAAQEILGISNDRVAFLYHDEFEGWQKGHPDKEYRWHVHFWSYFTDRLDEKLLESAKEYPLNTGERYWLHEEGTMCGRLFGRGGNHLWRWDGAKPVLLKEGLHQWVS